ncbi:MAG: nicotinamide-nucleotide amidohydrolase family protein [Christensenellales bacterium]|jgi:nicotinamide-nucleotide amidase
MRTQVKIFGYTADQLRQITSDIIGSRAVTVEIDENNLDSSLTIAGAGCDEREYNFVTSDILREVKDNLYGEGDATLGKMAVEYLSVRNKKLAVAESVTGGLIADKIVSVSGASSVFIEGLVTYSNESKIKRLNVMRFTLESHGAVSYECAHEMASGLMKNPQSDIALATTGIAGPSGGRVGKPVGLTYICVMDRYGDKVYNHIFTGERNSIREQAANTALFYLINKLKNA